MHMSKVKAHRSIEDGTSDFDRILIRGNSSADVVAGLGADLHPQPSSVEKATRSREWELYSHLLPQAAARICAAWPSTRQLLGGRLVWMGGSGVRRGRPGRVTIPPADRHQFLPIGGQIMCGTCLCRATSWQQARHRSAFQRCSGHSEGLRGAMAAHSHGHTLAMGVFRDKPQVICITCGKHTSTALLGLASNCVKATAKGREALNRFAKGWHPHPSQGKVPGEAFFRILESELQPFQPTCG